MIIFVHNYLTLPNLSIMEIQLDKVRITLFIVILFLVHLLFWTVVVNNFINQTYFGINTKQRW